MKALIVICLLILFSCEKESTYCWECNSVIYGRQIIDTVCYNEITAIEGYKRRLYDFYEGGCTDVKCELISKIDLN